MNLNKIQAVEESIEYDIKMGLNNCYDNISQNYTKINNN